MRAPIAWLALLLLPLPHAAGAAGADGVSPAPLWRRHAALPPGEAAADGASITAGGLPVQDGGTQDGGGTDGGRTDGDGGDVAMGPRIAPYTWTPFLRDGADPPPATPFWPPATPPPTVQRGRPPTAQGPPANDPGDDPGEDPALSGANPIAPPPPTATLFALRPDPPGEPAPDPPPPEPPPGEGFAWPIGEPATLALLGAALVAFGLMRRP
jgi:hypothetical protein